MLNPSRVIVLYARPSPDRRALKYRSASAAAIPQLRASLAGRRAWFGRARPLRDEREGAA